MNTKFYSLEPSFKTKETSKKKEILEIDAFNLMRKYLFSKIEMDEFATQLDILATHDILSKAEILAFMQDRCLYEAYLWTPTLSPEEVEKLKSRALYFKEISLDSIYTEVVK